MVEIHKVNSLHSNGKFSKSIQVIRGKQAIEHILMIIQ
jgi:hypothetical protein